MLTLILVVLVGGLNQRRVNSAAPQANRQSVASSAAVGLDKAATIYIAANVATQLELPVIDEVAKQVNSVDALSASGVSESGRADKPAIINTEGEVSHEIATYLTVEGDTIASIARANDIKPETLAWANSLNVEDELLANTELKIPPVNGVLYTAAEGDTVKSIASYYGTDAKAIVNFNDLEVYPLKAGRQIMIPGGAKPQPVVAVSNVQTSTDYRLAFLPAYNGNGYDWGWCTWWAAERRRQLGQPIPSNWGNANTWDDLAASTGNYRLSSAPIRGAIAQYDRGWAGHVAIVEDISADGRMIKISDMNGIAGWGAVGKAWVPVSEFETYIY